jgi:putative endonuclease
MKPTRRPAANVEVKRARLRSGRFAELFATAALMAKGYRILGRNVKTRAGEIDIIAVRGQRIAFVEVKRRANRDAAEAAILDAQATRIRNAADYWLTNRPRYHAHEQGYDLMLLIPRRWPRHIENGL